MLTQKKAKQMTHKAIKYRTKSCIKEIEKDIRNAIEMYRWEITRSVPNDVYNWVADAFCKRGFEVYPNESYDLSGLTPLTIDWSPVIIAEGGKGI